jgi:hypothetical protein
MNARSWTAGHPFDAGMTVPVFDRCLETVSQAHWYPVTESLCASASVRSRARGRRCAPGYVAGMVLEPEPVLVTDPTLTEVLDELRAREPLIDPLTVSVASWTRLWTSPWATTTG